jgi:hypothetical protein
MSQRTMKVGGPVSNKKGWDALYSLTESLQTLYSFKKYIIIPSIFLNVST